MSVQEKLKIILRLSLLTQEKLARELAVSFVTLNQWIHGKTTPHAKSLARIDDLYLRYTGQKIIPSDLLSAKKQILYAKRATHSNILSEIVARPDLNDQFTLSLTYNTNRIEGSSLTEDETADILFRNRALPNKHLIEQLEAKNHQAALQYLLNHLPVSKKIDESFVLKLHSILMNSIRDDAGIYRRHAVRIVGANIPTANYLKVPFLMESLYQKIALPDTDIIAHVARIHSDFEKIHPFSDGNGRIGRLIIHAMLFLANLPPAMILQEDKQLYYSFLNKSQREEDSSLLEDFICDAVLKSFEIIDFPFSSS